MIKKSQSGETQGCGCLGVIIACIVLWALCFGVTIDGKHYGLSGCSASKGVRIDAPK